jgi:molecular chaperone DnaJ
VAKRDYYEVLGVAGDASDADIKKAFRRLARECHPDVNPDDPAAAERFREAAEAYEILSAPDTRARYDRFGHAGVDSSQIHTERFMDLGSLSDLLGAFFGEDLFGMRRRGPARGADAAVALEVTLAEAATGARREVDVDLVVACDRCGGDGAEPGTEPERCPSCNGSGHVSQVQNTLFGQMVQTAACARCGGRGTVIASPCSGCRGRGRQQVTRTLEIEVPAGIHDGQRLRLPGRGHEGERGAAPGDLYVGVRVGADERFTRDGDDLVAALDVTFAQAAVGATLTVPTLDGEEPLEVPAGTQPGDVVVMRGRGMPVLGGRRRGDQRVVMNVRVPRRLTDEQRRLLQRFDELADDDAYEEDDSLFSRLRSAFR